MGHGKGKLDQIEQRKKSENFYSLSSLHHERRKSTLLALTGGRLVRLHPADPLTNLVGGNVDVGIVKVLIVNFILGVGLSHFLRYVIVKSGCLRRKSTVASAIDCAIDCYRYSGRLDLRSHF